MLWVVRCFCFDPPHPGCGLLLLGSMTFRGRLQVTRVSTGFKHLAFVVAGGRLFTHGSNALGQCCLRPDTIRTEAPVMVMERAVDVSCGTAFTVAATKAMTYFCGAYNYHPVTRENDSCVSISDRWIPLCFTVPPSRVIASGGYVNMRWDTFNMAMPILSGTEEGPLRARGSFRWGRRRYGGALVGPRPRWWVADDTTRGAPVCEACGRPLGGRVVVVTGCCLLHMDCAGICFVKAGKCPCGKTLSEPGCLGV